jgi:hypothetical protein
MSTAETARSLSVALFAAMNALTCAEAQLHENKRQQSETCIVLALVRAGRVAHAACEAALTRVEPMYDVAVCDAAEYEYASCKTAVACALENASVIVSALEHTGTQSSLSVHMCSDAAMRAAIDAENAGAVALGVVLLSEFRFIAPPRGLFLHALRRKSALCIVRLLLSSPVIIAHMTDRDD